MSNVDRVSGLQTLSFPTRLLAVVLRLAFALALGIGILAFVHVLVLRGHDAGGLLIRLWCLSVGTYVVLKSTRHKLKWE